MPELNAGFSPEQLRVYLPKPDRADSVWWIGFSGGLDSTALLHALAQLDLPITLHALHVNHQISPNANAWQHQCEQFCKQLGVAFLAEKVQVKNAGKGIEDAARAARYSIFERYVNPGDFLLTAHHSNDQAETLLLRLMRGTGPRGLAAIAGERKLATGGKLIRPLLHFSRSALETYAREQQLNWVDDESNQDDHYDRNFLRNQIMPLLQTRWPVFMRKWQQTAELCAQQETLLEEFAQQDLEGANSRTERVGQSIDLLWLKSLSVARRQNLLRYWLRRANCELPEATHWQQLEAQLFSAREDAAVEITWGQYSLRPYQDRLFLLPAEFPALKLQFIETVANNNAAPHYLRADLPDLEIRYRTGGERCKPFGRNHSQTLKKLFQEYQLEPWLRHRVPLVYSEENLVAVGDLWICDGYVAGQGEAGLLLTWR
ncbi:MAG TPA: tRNA lysidine(34) synthetase TilS [Cellvibrio sp.]|nr:tRNA lysidine(34) synthetase TilS [Cellvibrio sp.]